ncbi:MAG: signal peptide peptidase SppA [Chitinophagaceae bacterium]|nr:MAG: signal peptide peptidase SppA [Chitinophagaceae bacterium]
MNTFFKVFFASLLALAVFSVIMFFVLMGTISGLTSSQDVKTGSRAVLVVNLSDNYPEITTPNPLAALTESETYETPSLSEVIRLIHKAKSDSAIKGIYVNCGGNANDFGSNDEIRTALLDFKTSGKFIYAYGDVISQNAYHVASMADKVYCNPHGGLDWTGFVMQMAYLKGTLEKLEIEPQIFYAGKYKSATEPFRETKMTEPNRVQVTELLNDLYGHFLQQVSSSRKIDTASLRRFAVESLIRFPKDALNYKLVDGLRYDDEVRNEIRTGLKIPATEKINFISLGKYLQAVSLRKTGTDRIAVIYAAGNIVDGKGDRTQIGGDTYRNLVRKARLDKNIKAIVLRINSGGGSALASENIWRELTLAKKEKPLIVSFGDVAASGGYYIAAAADTIFSQPNTITGSIGVFSLIPNMKGLFNNKLGMTFDAVKTAPDADAGTVVQPLTASQARYFQQSVDSIYHLFKQRVADGRKLPIEQVDSIGQGRIWSGSRAISIGLVDRIGGLEDAIASAATMAKLKDYGLREYPEPQNIFSYFMGSREETMKRESIERELGKEGLKTYQALRSLKDMIGITQARLPFTYQLQQ